MSRTELRAQAKQLGVKGYSRMSVAALTAAIDAMRSAAHDRVRKIDKNRPEQNGIKRPTAGGICAKIWDFCDATARSAKDVRAFAAEQGLNVNNALMEFYAHRRFNGITGRQ